uniref:C2H2-type domain-containing protein n=1 Tax=Haplochromis burtoni TaxID=8153 RepID=A0A3Q2W5P8_HAPBU
MLLSLLIASGREENEIEMGEADSEEPAADLIAGSSAEGKESFRNCNKRKEEKVERNDKSKNELKSCDSKMQSRVSKKQKIRHPGVTRTKTEKSVANLSCLVCGALRFKLPGTLRQHEKIHTNRERSYLCDICCKMFLTSAQLEIHMRIHTNEKPYHCSECGKGFSTKGPLTVHKRCQSYSAQTLSKALLIYGVKSPVLIGQPAPCFYSILLALEGLRELKCCI